MLEEKVETSEWEARNSFAGFGEACGFMDKGEISPVGNTALWKRGRKTDSGL